MKKEIFLTFLLLFFLGSNLRAQSPNTCDNALTFCPKKDVSYQLREQDCLNGTSRVFVEFEALTNGVTGGFLRYSLSSSATSTYNVYGPFSDNDNACDLMTTYQAPILTQGNGIVSAQTQLNFSIVSGKKYVVEVLINSCVGTFTMIDQSPLTRSIVKCGPDNINVCEDCIPKFLPSNGTYVISAWVKEDAPVNTTNYTNSQIIVSTNTTVFPAFTPTGQIIDGWQRIEGVFTTSNIQAIAIELKSLSGTSYFDDIRIFPFDGSMMSYVYDPISLRLLAELDERNYAKFYEYDEEGKLIRVKKETEKGIMTIQENRENNAVREE